MFLYMAWSSQTAADEMTELDEKKKKLYTCSWEIIHVYIAVTKSQKKVKAEVISG